MPRIVGGGGLHAALPDVSIDQHHTRDHALSGAIHTGTMNHAALAAIGADDHHTTAHGVAQHTATFSTAQASSDVTITPSNTWVTGASVSLAAGTWVIMGVLTINQTGQNVWGMRIRNQTDGVTYASASADTKSAGTANDQQSFPLVWVVALAATKTVAIEAVNASPQGSVKAALNTNGQGNNATTLVAFRIA